MFETSEEDILSKGLGFFKGKVKISNSFNKKCLKIPAIGWISFKNKRDFEYSKNNEEDFYFTHSYYGSRG